MDLHQRIECVKLYYSNNCTAAVTLRAYKTAHGLRADPFSATTISRLIKRFETTGSVLDLPKSGRPSLTEDRKDDVLDTLKNLQKENIIGVASTAQVSTATGIPKRSVCRILREELQFYPYKLQLTQMMSEDDHQKRVQYAQFLLNRIDILNSILWTDEAYFYVNGYVHRKNCVIWGTERPKLTVQSALHSPQVCVWIGFTANMMLPPYFFTGTVTGDSYRHMLGTMFFQNCIVEM